MVFRRRKKKELRVEKNFLLYEILKIRIRSNSYSLYIEVSVYWKELGKQDGRVEKINSAPRSGAGQTGR